MPFHLEKGPIFATLEALYNDPEELPGFLLEMWKGKPLGKHGALTSPSADDKNHPDSANATPAKRMGSMLRDWFGEVKPDGTQPDWGEDHPVTHRPTFTTGYWSHYYGDVRAIVAQTLVRAGEVALGVDRPPNPLPETPPPRTRHWRVEFFWKCGQPRFEGWVTWRNHQNAGSGQVTVIFATPATPDQVLSRPADAADPFTPGTWKEIWQGMWVCSHANHKQYVVITSLPTPSQQFVVPTSAVMYTRGVENVGTWAPWFGSGGPAPEAKEFVQGPEEV